MPGLGVHARDTSLRGAARGTTRPTMLRAGAGAYVAAASASAALSTSGGSVPVSADVAFRSWSPSGDPGCRQHGVGGHEQIHEPGEPGRVPAPDGRAAGHRHVLHGLVLRLRGHVHQVHARHLQGAAHLPRGLALHGLRGPLPAALGRHLRVSPGVGSVCMKSPRPAFVSLPFLYHWLLINGGVCLCK